MYVRTIVKPLRPTTPKTQKKAKMTQDCKNVALKLPKIFLSKGYFGQFKGYILCSGNVGGFFASEGGSCHRGFTIVLMCMGAASECGAVLPILERKRECQYSYTL